MYIHMSYMYNRTKSTALSLLMLRYSYSSVQSLTQQQLYSTKHKKAAIYAALNEIKLLSTDTWL